MDELVTSGRSVSIGVSGCVHSAAAAAPIPASDAARSAESLSAPNSFVRAASARFIRDQQLGLSGSRWAGRTIVKGGPVARILRCTGFCGAIVRVREIVPASPELHRNMIAARRNLFPWTTLILECLSTKAAEASRRE
jgi:hypothetical protein